MTRVPPVLHEEIVLRAGNRCEYCQLSQVGQEAMFHVDHVVPRAAGGPTGADNLASFFQRHRHPAEGGDWFMPP